MPKALSRRRKSSRRKASRRKASRHKTHRVRSSRGGKLTNAQALGEAQIATQINNGMYGQANFI